ncbi:WD40 repeat domain-containing protein [Candidatus Poribacteria bacterium]|nr:WD40 repeat domain-containing protein [Candidatus Poribacteria bacterium]MYI92949.1 WD40 repeat domain-containing protein [Candidatus Poribacteria bacterium]
MYTNSNLSFSPDGQTLASLSHQNSTVRIWDVKSGEILDILPDHSSSVWDMSFNPNGQMISTVSQGEVRLLDVRTGETLQTLIGYTASFSPNGEILAFSGSDPIVNLMNTNSGDIPQTLSLDHRAIHISFGHDGQTMAILDAEGIINLWDIKTDTVQKTITELGRFHGNRFHGNISFSPDLRFLARTRYEISTDSHSTIHLMDAITGRLLHTLYGHADSVRWLTFSADGQILASASTDRTVRLWDVETGRLAKVPFVHTSWVDSMSLSSDGQTLASGGLDGIVYLWNIETGEQIDILTGYSRGITGLSFSSDGETLAIGRADGTIYLWETVPTSVEPDRDKSDINADGVVDVQDLVLVAADFGKMGEYKTDVNGDGKVNIQDLVVVVAAFHD